MPPLARGELEDVRDDAVARFGSIAGFMSVAGAARLAAEASIARRKDAALAGRLIARKPLRAFVFGAIDGEFRRLLTDVPQRAAAQLVPRIQSGAKREEVREYLRDIISASLATMKSRVAKSLSMIAPTDNPPAVGANPGPAQPPAIEPKLHQALTSRLQGVAAPKVVDLLLRIMARAAAGKPWANAVFDEALAIRSEVEGEAVAAVARILTEHIDTAIRDHARQQKDEVTDAQATA